MSLLTRIAAAFTREPRVFPGLDTRSIALTYPPYVTGKPQWLPTDPATLALEGYDKVVVAFACVNVLANAVASAPLRAYQHTGTSDHTAMPPSPSSSPGRLAALVQDPNPYESQPEFIESVVKIAAVTGVCVYEKFRAPAGNVIALYPLRTDWLRPVPRTNQAYDWEYHIPGIRTPFALPYEDVGVFRFNSSVTMSPLGTPPLQAAMRQVAIENQMADFVKLFFQNNAVPSWIAVLKDEFAGVSQADADVIKEAINQRYGGNRGAGQVGIFPALDRLERVALDFNEMAFPDLSDMTAASICSAFAVPPILIHTKLGLDASTYSNYGQARRAFYEDTITPLWRRLDGAMTRALLPEFDVPPNVTLEFDTSEIPALQDDLTNERAQKIQLWRSQAITLDEIRSDFGYKELGGEVGEAFYTPTSPFGAGLLGDGNDTGDDSRSYRSQGRTIVVHKSGSRPEIAMLPDGRTVEYDLGSRATIMVIGDKKPRPEPRMQRLPPETRAAVAKSARDAYDQLAATGAPALRRFWRAQGERVIAVAATRDAARGVEARDIAQINWDEEEDLLAEVLEEIHTEATRRGWIAAADMGIPASAYDIASTFTASVLGELAARIKGISDTTQADVRRVVGAALDEGVTVEDLAARLKGLFEETYQGRAVTVARTESQVAYNLGTVAAGKASGVVSYAELMDNAAHTEGYGASDGLSCAERDGLIVPLDSVGRHVAAEHPNGSLAMSLVVTELDE